MPTLEATRRLRLFTFVSSPLDAGYQNLFRRQPGGQFRYLNNTDNTTSFGRVPTERGNSTRSYLMEVLTGREHDGTLDYDGAYDHTPLLNDDEVRMLYAVLDAGLPYVARCSDKNITAGPNAGEAWGEPSATPQGL